MDDEKPKNKAKLMKKRTSPWTGEGTKPWMAEGRTMQERLSRTTQEQLPSVRLVHEHFEEVSSYPTNNYMMEGATQLSGFSSFVHGL